MIFFILGGEKKGGFQGEQVLGVEDASGNSVKKLLTRVKRFEGVFKWAKSNKNVVANV